MKNKYQRSAARIVLIIAFAAFLYNPSVGLAGLLGTAEDFAVLGGSAVTITGPTSIYGDVGVWPSSTYTDDGFVTLNGTLHLGDGVAMAAQGDVTTAYNFLAGLPADFDYTGVDLGGLILAPAVYFFSSSAQLTGTLTLDASADPNGLYVFQIGSTLVTAPSAVVNVINGGPDLGVFWQVGSSATLDTTTAFAGNILALTSITMNTDASILCGRALARNGAVTLDSNTISIDCDAEDFNSLRGDFGSVGFASPSIVIPEPGTVQMLGVGLLALTLYGWQSRFRFRRSPKTRRP